MEQNYGLEQAKAQLESIKEMMVALKEMDKGVYKEELSDALEILQQSPLSVQVRSGWHTPGAEGMGAEEFEILLCTGGPAVRIVGGLDEDNEPVKPHIQYQDWGTPWTNYPLTDDEYHTVLGYCQQFYYGE